MNDTNPREVISTITRLVGWPPTAFQARHRARPESRALFWIHGLPRNSEKSVVQGSRRLVTSAHGEDIPAVFGLLGENGKVSIGVGTCIFDSKDALKSNEHQAEVLDRLIHFAYPGSEFVRENSPVFSRHEWACVWVGVPRIGQIARIARALSGMKFALHIIAEPLKVHMVTDLVDAAGNLQRTYQATVADSKLTEPSIVLLQSYLERLIKRMQIATVIGGWRVGVYMMADAKSADACKAIYRAAFGASTPGLEQLSSWSGPEVNSWAVQWALPDSKLVHDLVPYPWQTVLSSNELANLMCLPFEELPGFRLLDQPRFDVIPPFVFLDKESSKQALTAVSVGEVMSEGRGIKLDYSIRSEELTKHCFIAGTTGSGKTNTVFYLLQQLTLQNIPFLVIEPTKKEYRALIREPQYKGLQVYTLGNELGIPLRLNPLAPEPNTPIEGHIDLLKGVIGASIGAWNPLPQILEKALYRVFRDSGWDIVRGTNYRVQDSVAPASAYPTLEDLLQAALEVTRELGYSERVGPDIEAALRVRLESLLTGGKGRMLGTTEQFSVEQLVSRPTILELESIVDEDECAFVMGVILIRIVEHLRARGNSSNCRLVVVIEEAHRLLGEAQRGNPEVEGNARFKAVSMFANLLAEVRAYGAGFVICDQSPSKLVRDVIKNTNTKVAHRIVSADDATALTIAMRLRPDQAGSLASLAPLTAAVFSGGDDYPVLVRVPFVKGTDPWPTNEELRSTISERTAEPRGETFWRDRLISVDEWIESIERLLNVLVVTPVEAGLAWSETKEIALRHFPSLAEHEEILVLTACETVQRSLRERGRLYGWDFKELESLMSVLDAVVGALSAVDPHTPMDRAFLERVRRMHQLPRGPLLSCNLSCADGQGVVCIFRSQGRRLSETRDWIDEWRRVAMESSSNKQEKLIDLIVQASETMMGSIPTGERQVWLRRAAFCFAQHVISKEMSGRPAKSVLETNSFIWNRIKDLQT